MAEEVKTKITRDIGNVHHSTVSLSNKSERKKNIYYPFKKKNNKLVLSTQINLAKEAKVFKTKKEMKLVKKSTLSTQKMKNIKKKDKKKSSTLFVMLI